MNLSRKISLHPKQSFSNGDRVFPTEKNGEETIVYVPNDSGVINYTAKVSANALLSIGGKRILQSGKITVKNIDSFNLYVIAQDFETVKKYCFRIEKEG